MAQQDFTKGASLLSMMQDMMEGLNSEGQPTAQELIKMMEQAQSLHPASYGAANINEISGAGYDAGKLIRAQQQWRRNAMRAEHHIKQQIKSLMQQRQEASDMAEELRGESPEDYAAALLLFAEAGKQIKGWELLLHQAQAEYRYAQQGVDAARRAYR